MSTSLMAQVWDCEAEPLQKFSLLAIADACGDRFTIRQALQTVIRKCGIEQYDAEEMIASLFESGYLVSSDEDCYLWCSNEVYTPRPQFPKPKRTPTTKGASWATNTLAERDGGYICAYCHCDVVPGENCTVDHVIPVSRGGSNNIDNLVLACKSCNSRKGDKTADEYNAWLVRVSGD